jgi:GT2 family glycosyltransferase
VQNTISVVIVTHNRPRDATAAVQSCLRQSRRPHEVIVVDDGSASPYAGPVRSSRLRILRVHSSVGVSHARNRGVRAARGRFVAFLDDDAIADVGWLEAVHRGIAAGAQVMGGPIVPRYAAAPPPWWDAAAFGVYTSTGNAPDRYADPIWGANMVVRRDVFRRVGLFDPRLGRQRGTLLSREDAELVTRARRAGCPIAFLPAARVYHTVRPYRFTLRYILRWEYDMGRSVRIERGPASLADLASTLARLAANILFFLASFTVVDTGRRVLRVAHIANLVGTLWSTRTRRKPGRSRAAPSRA